MKLYIINGPNLNMLGIREPDHYGRTTFAELEKIVKTIIKTLGGYFHERIKYE